MPDCIFCAIAAGAIPATVVLETETTLAFRDLSPKAATHVLVIPKQHYANVAELTAADPALAADLLTTATAVAEQEAAAAAGYRLIFNTGAGGGQTVFHAHLHLLAGPTLPGF